MTKGIFYITINNFNGRKEFKAEQKSGYIETLENGVKVGYDKRGSRWHANELTTGFGICSEKSKKALVEKIHELEKWGKLEHINRMLEREADDLRTNVGRAAKCIAEAYAS